MEQKEKANLKDGLTTTQKREKNLANRDEIIQNYQKAEVADVKSIICRFWRRGLCIFLAEDCKYAHGVNDLRFNKLDIEAFDKLSQKDQDANARNGTDDEDNEDKVLDQNREKQPSLNLEIVYKTLYEYQFVLQQRGEVDKIYTLEELSQIREVRRAIRDKFLKENTQAFVDYLFQLYGRRYLRRAFIEKCFASVDWKPRWAFILDGKFAYEVKSPSEGFVILKLPQGEKFDEYMEDCIIKIVKDNNLLEKLPISPSIISKIYYKDILGKDPFLPNLQIFLKKVNMKLDEYLKILQSDKKFLAKLGLVVGKSVEELSQHTIFDNTANELKALAKKMEKVLHELIEKSSIGFVLFSRFEGAITKKCASEVQQFNNNHAYLKRLMKQVAISSQVLIINLLSEVYLFSLPKFKKIKYEAIKSKYLKKLDKSCLSGEKPEARIIHDNPLYKSEDDPDVKVEDRFDEEFLKKQIDFQKIIVVDNLETINIAREALLQVDDVGVDLEGNLDKDGVLELVQISCKDKIFIFDVYGVSKNVLTQKDAENSEVYEKMMDLMKDVMEDPNICKVFHDCRKDSVALHSHFKACPKNIFDVSGVYTFIENLERYLSFSNLLHLKELNEEAKVEENQKKSKKEELNEHDALEILRNLEDLKPPGLNDVLSRYNASHGINSLKHVMKNRFVQLPREYFLNRPIDKEFLIYSAKDVEDLVEVKDKMIKRLQELLTMIYGNVDITKVNILCHKISKTYSWYGCSH